ncbi:MAG TPA: imidazole glycerol phosphate synthase subunit HisH [Candidatus Dormibacteraeota bacterium]|nr:imidazole glycerol phosphate synthase subunit HisH [Candidatus Dormibacteraeota bacterium]
MKQGAVKMSIVDYGAGNLPSVERALQSLGAQTERVTRPEQLAAARVVVLPGVGHFAAFVDGLEERSLTETLRTVSDSGVPILGICLGLQALFSSSREAPGKAGLNFISGEVEALPKNVKSPHIGWNQVRHQRESILLRGIPEEAYFYFAHSYAARGKEEHTVGVCDHGFPFAAVIERGNLMGVQFHPEKSGGAGAKLLQNFFESVQ